MASMSWRQTPFLLRVVHDDPRGDLALDETADAVGRGWDARRIRVDDPAWLVEVRAQVAGDDPDDPVWWHAFVRDEQFVDVMASIRDDPWVVDVAIRRIDPGKWVVVETAPDVA